MNVDVDELAAQPDRYVGKTVRVRGDIEEVAGPRVFTLDEDSLTATTDLLVVLPRRSVVLHDNSAVIVRGVVHALTRAELERDYSWLQTDPAWLLRFEKRPIIMATALESATGADLLAKSNADSDKSSSEQAQAPAKTSTSEVAREPGKFYGRRIQVRSVVEDVFSANMFTLDEDALFAGPDLLVIADKPAKAMVDGTVVRATGTLRRFTWTEIRRDYGPLGLNADLVAAFESRPVLIATSVVRQPSDR